jgi:hypothetical protein
MLKANKLHQLMNITADQLTWIIQDSGFADDGFVSTKFRSLAAPEPTDYCFSYDAEFLNEFNELERTLVFVSYDPVTDKITAQY